MTPTGSVPRLASAASGGSAASDADADLARLETETRRLNAEADLLMARDRKRMAEEALRQRFMPAWAVAAAASGGSLMTALILLLTGAS